ncbi:MAG TPA: hypothetical protein VKZ53_18690 [Candidatus Angelobacter sp.]|nr:hypothetical protein [Candidatus Angelobacter sp.]
MQAQTAVGLIYYQGNNAEIPQNYPQAFFWLSKAAAQDSYAAEKKLVDMYMLGQGTPRNAEIVRFYGEKAADLKHGTRTRQTGAVASAARRAAGSRRR